MNELYKVESRQAVVTVAAYIEECVDIPKFLTYCEACRNYNNRWSCPPYDFDPLTIWRQYTTLHLFARILTPLQPGQDMATAARCLAGEKALFLDELLEMEKKYPGSRALSAGTCELCGREERCQRQDGRPCLYPKKMRYSIEALGGDVGLTAERYLASPLVWMKDGIWSDYLTLVGGLLQK